MDKNFTLIIEVGKWRGTYRLNLYEATLAIAIPLVIIGGAVVGLIELLLHAQ